MLSITSLTTVGNTTLAQYTIDGQRAASFVPSICETAHDALIWLRASLTAGRAAAAAIITALKEIAMPTTQPLSLEDKLKEINEANSSWISCELWTRVAGKESVYVTLTAKSNGGKSWNQGIGAKWRIELASGRVSQTQQWAGAATRKDYESDVQEVIDQITEYLR